MSRAAAAPKFDVADVPFVPTILIDLNAITESPLNPRKHKPELTEGFLLSIATQGVIEPIVVRDVQADAKWPKGVKFEIVAGEQRFRACQKVGRTQIPATVRNVTNLELIVLALDENKYRKDMHPLDEAKALADVQAADPVYRDLDALGKRFRVSATYVRDKLKLLRLPPVVVEALDAEAITLKHAELIATLPADQYEMGLAECFTEFVERDPDDKSNVTNRDSIIKARNWTRLAPALLSTRQFHAWARDNGKADLSDGTVQKDLLAQLGDKAPALPLADAATAVPKLVLHLSTDQWLSADERKALGVIPADGWRKVGKDDHCEYTKPGALVHGSQFGRSGRKVVVFDVCIEDKCQKHNPAAVHRSTSPTPSRGGSSKPSAAEKAANTRARAEAEKRKAAAEAWKTDEPFYRRALGALFVKTKLDVVKYVERHINARVTHVEKEFGIKFTPATALHFLELDNVYAGTLDGFMSEAKNLGLSKAQLEAEFKRIAPKPAEPKKAATPATKKAAKKKGGKK